MSKEAINDADLSRPETKAGRLQRACGSRVALTPQQVARSPRLRQLAIDKIDRRYNPPRPYQAIECEAVGQLTLERMLRARLDALLPEPLERVVVPEQRQHQAAGCPAPRQAMTFHRRRS
jgi:hypothetical protein